MVSQNAFAIQETCTQTLTGKMHFTILHAELDTLINTNRPYIVFATNNRTQVLQTSTIFTVTDA